MVKPENSPQSSPNDPVLDAAWMNWKVGLGMIFGGATVFAIADRMRGKDERQMGSYYRLLQQSIEQGHNLRLNPDEVLIELPENRSFTAWISAAASKQGFAIAIHTPEDVLPHTIPQFVTGIRSFQIRAFGFFFEEIDVEEGCEKRTISTFAGKRNTLGLYNSSEPQRAERILWGLDHGRRLLIANGMSYQPPVPPTTA